MMSVRILLISSLFRFSRENLLFYRTKPNFESAKLEINGFVQVPGDSPFIASSTDDDVKLSLLVPTENISDQGIQQRFLGLPGFPVLPGLVYSPKSTRTVTKTELATLHTIVSTCLACAVDNGGKTLTSCNPLALNTQNKRPAACSLRKRDAQFSRHFEPSKMFKVATTELPTFEASPVNVESSREDTLSQERSLFNLNFAQNRDRFEYVVETTETVTLTLTNTADTVTFQVGTLNCLYRFMTAYPDCNLD